MIAHKGNRIVRASAVTTAAAAAVAGLGLARAVQAADITWQGAPSTPLSFGTGGNWVGGNVPDAPDNAIINNGGIATVPAAFTRSITNLTLGSAAASTGSIQFTGGTINASGNAAIGGNATGAGTFSISSGQLNVGSGFVGDFAIGDDGAGTASISGGVLNVGNAYLGRSTNGHGHVTQTGGTFTVRGKFVLAELKPANVAAPQTPSDYTMSGGNISVGTEMYIGAHGPVTFSLSNTGSIGVVGTLHVGASGGFTDPPKGVGTLNVSGGTINISGANAHLVIGDNGDGTFNFSGGTIVTKHYNIGQNFELGFTTTGIVNHTGGNITAEFGWVVGEASTSANMYDLSGGSVTVTGDQATGGMIEPGDLNVGGLGGRGTLLVRNTGQANIAASAHVGTQAAAQGSISISGGTFAIGTNGLGTSQFIVGENGIGRLSVSGGNVSTDFLTFGQNSAATGTGTMTGGTFTVRSAVSVGETSNNANFFDISGGSLSAVGIFVGSNGTGTLRVGGTAIVNASTNLESSSAGTGTVIVNGGSLTAGSFLNKGAYNQSAGSTSLGAVTGTGSATVGGGTMGVASIRQGLLSISSTGQVNVAANGTSTGTSVVSNLTLAGSGKLNLNNNALVVDYNSPTPTPFTAVRAAIVSAYTGGTWTGPGITSALANNTTHGIGYAERSALSSVPAIFGTVDADAVLVRYTRYGDADLNGIVNLLDFNALAANFNQNNRNWNQGDFDYNGLVNLLDFNKLAANFNQVATGTIDPTPEDWANLAAAIPEPTSLMMLVGACLGLRRRRGA